METFVLRIFPPEPDLDTELHGRLEHVASGAALVFHTTEELVSALADLAAPEVAKAPGKRLVNRP